VATGKNMVKPKRQIGHAIEENRSQGRSSSATGEATSKKPEAFWRAAGIPHAGATPLCCPPFQKMYTNPIVNRRRDAGSDSPSPRPAGWGAATAAMAGEVLVADVAADVSPRHLKN
jgi:hypothetical protein